MNGKKKNPYDLNNIIPTLKMWALKHREVKQLVQGHTACMCQSQDSDPGSLALETIIQYPKLPLHWCGVYVHCCIHLDKILKDQNQNLNSGYLWVGL